MVTAGRRVAASQGVDARTMPQSNRVYSMNDRPSRDGRYILYWMQRAQRARFNHALEHAVHRANEASLPPVSYTHLTLPTNREV